MAGHSSVHFIFTVPWIIAYHWRETLVWIAIESEFINNASVCSRTQGSVGSERRVNTFQNFRCESELVIQEQWEVDFFSLQLFIQDALPCHWYYFWWQCFYIGTRFSWGLVCKICIILIFTVIIIIVEIHIVSLAYSKREMGICLWVWIEIEYFFNVSVLSSPDK